MNAGSEDVQILFQKHEGGGFLGHVNGGVHGYVRVGGVEGGNIFVGQLVKLGVSRDVAWLPGEGRVDGVLVAGLEPGVQVGMVPDLVPFATEGVPGLGSC